MMRMNSMLVLSLAGAMTSATAAQTLFFSEDWESFPLSPAIDEITLDPTFPTDPFFFGDAVDSIPFNGEWNFGGWSMSFNLPGIGTAEWQGWSIVDNSLWPEADEQLRRDFQGNIQTKIAVADPDEWDDFEFEDVDPDGDGRVYTTDLTSPRIPITGADEGTLFVRFNSSWRPEDIQTAELRVSYDDGPFDTKLRWTSDASDPVFDAETNPFGFKPDSSNEIINISIDNPAEASQVRLQFGMPQAENDWWWAIDNVQLLGEGTGGLPGPPGAFQILLNPEIDTTVPLIEWQSSGNALDYEIVIANDENFTDVVFNQILGGTSVQIQPGTLVNGLYYVKVTASNPDGDVESSGSFLVNNPNPFDLDSNGVVDQIDNLLYLNFVDPVRD